MVDSDEDQLELVGDIRGDETPASQIWDEIDNKGLLEDMEEHYKKMTPEEKEAFKQKCDAISPKCHDALVEWSSSTISLWLTEQEDDQVSKKAMAAMLRIVPNEIKQAKMAK